MKLKNENKLISITVYALITITIIQFIYALGFMTNFYRLFYDGTNEMFSFYKELQLLNKFIFDAALFSLILSLFLVSFDFHKHHRSFFGKFLVIGMNIYYINNFMVASRAFPYYKEEYLKLDFSGLVDYHVFPQIFTIGFVLLLLCVLLGIALVGVIGHCMVKDWQIKKGNKA